MNVVEIHGLYLSSNIIVVLLERLRHEIPPHRIWIVELVGAAHAKEDQ